MSNILSDIKNRVLQLQRKYFDPKLDVRVQTFNLLTFAGILAGLAVAVSCALTGAGIANIAANLLAAALAFVLLSYATRTHRYQTCYLITIIVIFIIVFPFLFFTAGGYHSGMPCFFTFAIPFTALMLEGKKKFVAIITEIMLYSACCLIAYYFPESVTPFANEWGVVLDTITGMIISGALLLLVILLYIRMYNEHKRSFERLNMLKTEFLGNVSHELKTPLTVISVYAQESERIALDSPELAGHRQKMKLIAAEADRLALIVSQVSDITRIDEGQLHLNVRPVSLSQIIQSTLHTYYPVFSKNNNTVELVRGGGSPTVLCDAHRVAQVLVNLISNASRHTYDGKIIIGVKEDKDFAEVSVSDNGAGISEHRLPSMFERYRNRNQDENSRADTDTGTGLGLHICKHIVEAHGGQISIESKESIGTTVRFSLPLQK